MKRGATSEILQGLMGKAASEGEIGAAKLCICFLKDLEPELVPWGLCKQGSAVHMAREVIIDGDLLPFSIFAESDPV